MRCPCSHLAEKSLIIQSLTKNARCFIPGLLIENPEVCFKRFNRLLKDLVSTKQIADRFAEETKQQFPKFLNVAKENGQEFQEFEPSFKDHRLDTFYWKHIEGAKSVEKVAEVLKIILTLSHGQASVERGFSVNSSLLVENLSAKSLISQRIIHDHMAENQLVPENFVICEKLRKSVRGARVKYEYLEDQRKQKVDTEKSLKRKSIQEQIDVVRVKKSLLERTILGLSKDANKYALDAENESTMENMKVVLSKSNSFRKTVSEKEEEMKECTKVL